MNPLAKVPTLVTDDGDGLFENRVICEFIASLVGGSKLLLEGPLRWSLLKDQALADGLLDAALLSRYEATVRPEAYQWGDWSNGQLEKVVAALDRFEAGAGGLGERVDVGTIAIGCALGYLDFRFPNLSWRSSRPMLAEWFEAFDARPTTASSRPHV